MHGHKGLSMHIQVLWHISAYCRSFFIMSCNPSWIKSFVSGIHFHLELIGACINGNFWSPSNCADYWAHLPSLTTFTVSDTDSSVDACVFFLVFSLCVGTLWFLLSFRVYSYQVFYLYVFICLYETAWMPEVSIEPVRIQLFHLDFNCNKQGFNKGDRLGIAMGALANPTEFLFVPLHDYEILHVLLVVKIEGNHR